MIASMPLLVFPFCLIAAALTDMRRFIIPNELSLALMAGFVVAFAMAGLGWQAFFLHVAVGAATLAVGFGLWVARVLGAGDVKLLAAAALWLGWPSLGPALVYIALAGGVLAVGILLARGAAWMLPGLGARWAPLARLAATEKPNAPYGVAIAVGALAAFPQSALFAALS